MMKQMRYLLTLMLLLAPVSWGQQANNDHQEAKRQFKAFWASKITLCPDSDVWVTKTFEGKGLMVIKKILGIAGEHNLSEVDRLNGVEYKGESAIEVGLHRNWHKDTGWSDWQDNTWTYRVYLTKKNGTWTLEPDFSSKTWLENISAGNCSDIPPGSGITPKTTARR